MTRKKSQGSAMLLRCSDDDVSRLDALVDRIPMATRSGLAREAMRVGLTVLEEDPTRLITGFPAGPRSAHARVAEPAAHYNSTFGARKNMVRPPADAASAHKGAAISRRRQRHGDHPFVAVVQERYGSVSAWAVRQGLKIPTVASWYSRGKLRRPIPRAWADHIAAELGVPATEATWPNGIK